MARLRYAVVGGGISGLAAAYRLQGKGHAVTVFEAGERCGGKIHSERVDGLLVEWGPNAFLSSREPLARLIDDLGIRDDVIQADPAAKRRYLLRPEGLVAVNPRSLLAGDLLSWRGRLRLLGEAVVRSKPQEDQSVRDFLRERLGTDAGDLLADPLVAGIYAGDPDKLAMSAAFPNVFQMVAERGSLVRGALAKRGAPRGRVCSFREGMGTLIRALESAVEVRLGAPVDDLARGGDGWQVAGETFDRVVLAIPPPALRTFTEAPIRCAPAAVVSLAFDDLPRELDGFGYLVPASAGQAVVGVQWTSAIFPQHSDGRGFLRAVVGGDRRPAALDMDDEALLDTVLADLRVALPELPAPSFSHIVRWSAGIPQYEIGHQARVRRIRELEREGLVLAGNAYFGVSVPDCAARAEVIAAAG